MISAILLFYIGAKIDAPWWYFGLIALWGLWAIFDASIMSGGDDDYD